MTTLELCLGNDWDLRNRTEAFTGATCTLSIRLCQEPEHYLRWDIQDLSKVNTQYNDKDDSYNKDNDNVPSVLIPSSQSLHFIAVNTISQSS